MYVRLCIRLMCFVICVCFFFKHKTAYERRISDWSSDVCSSDLGAVGSHLKALGEDDGSVRFAWQLRAGAAVKVTKGIDLTADYTYRQTGSGKLNFGDEDVEYRLGKTKASLFQVGLRFTL